MALTRLNETLFGYDKTRTYGASVATPQSHVDERIGTDRKTGDDGERKADISKPRQRHVEIRYEFAKRHTYPPFSDTDPKHQNLNPFTVSDWSVPKRSRCEAELWNTHRRRARGWLSSKLRQKCVAGGGGFERGKGPAEVGWFQGE